MPFGLSGAAANFQKAIDIILRPVLRKYVSVYMNDVIISSPSFAHHVEHLRKAVIWALNKFRTYFGPDHAALTKMTQGKNLSSRMIRWALKLAEFNVEWKQRPGAQNVLADVLSRNPVENIVGENIACAE
ncbi:hypothetical protein TNCV_4553161 [Trichonephila clavipes]|nr:hypothetical protein TNCV_4553161 [Trichonephila clavipes]